MIADTAETWRPTQPVDDLWEGEMSPVVVEGVAVLLLNVEGEVRAYENRCPHQASPLDEGDFDGTVLTCLKHMWEFDAASGNGLNPANARLKGLPCKVGDDGIILVDVG